MAKNKNTKNLTIGILIVVLAIAVTVGTALYLKPTSNTQVSTRETSEPNLSENTSQYKNGVYSVDGNYISPGGAEHIEVTITLEGGEIVDSEVVPTATHEISIEMQNDFANNYKPFVIGKNIDEVNLTKVSGSSLTPQGFNDALEKVKDQARI